METTIVYWGYTGIMENKMDTTMIYWSYIGRLVLGNLQHEISECGRCWQGQHATHMPERCRLRICTDVLKGFTEIAEVGKESSSMQGLGRPARETMKCGNFCVLPGVRLMH